MTTRRNFGSIADISNTAISQIMAKATALL